MKLKLNGYHASATITVAYCLNSNLWKDVHLTTGIGMIFAIEGPDCSGKSTLFTQLQTIVAARFVRLPPLKQVTHEAMQRELDMWEALYDPAQVYVCDRHVITTDRVYAAYYGRPQLPPSWIETHLRVVYIQVEETELVRRHHIRGEIVQDPSRYSEILELYSSMLTSFCHIVHINLTTTVEWINERLRQRD